MSKIDSAESLNNPSGQDAVNGITGHVRLRTKGHQRTSTPTQDHASARSTSPRPINPVISIATTALSTYLKAVFMCLLATWLAVREIWCEARDYIVKEKRGNDNFQQTIEFITVNPEKHTEEIRRSAAVQLDCAWRDDVISRKFVTEVIPHMKCEYFKDGPQQIARAYNQTSIDACGTIKLQWRPASSDGHESPYWIPAKTYTTIFYVSEQHDVDADVIIGSRTINEHGLSVPRSFMATPRVLRPEAPKHSQYPVSLTAITSNAADTSEQILS
ncbi:hypothetical protein H2199_001416 [Coniosporium tulheliwenetii]|nr:hypothetical protein H2199_001416 [Cladosporium sp. JES 115]